MNKIKIEAGEKVSREVWKIEYITKANKKYYVLVEETYQELNGSNVVMKWNAEDLIGIIFNVQDLIQNNLKI